MDNIRLSVSKTKTFIGCKKQFHFNYILKMPQKERDYHTLGKLCHKVLEDFHLYYIAGGKDDLNTTMSKYYKLGLEEYKDKTTKEIKAEAFEILKNYLKNSYANKNDIAKVLSCEENFSFNISENVVLNGMIDRVQLDDDGILRISDYKTTKNKKYLKDDYMQLLTYGLVMYNKDPSIKKVRGSYILLRHNCEEITKDFSIDEILETKAKYLKYAEEILNEKEYTANPTVLCGWCPYLEHCDEGKKQTKTEEIKW